MRYLILIVFACVACDSGGGEEEGEKPTGATCPPGNTLTYETFGEKFMSDFCTRCHSSEVSGDLRLDAPEDTNFDTLNGIKQHLAHIDANAAAGPLATNEIMPDADPRPTLEQRTQLGQWIACGAPADP